MRIWGDYWEDVAFDYLKKNGLKIVKRNFNCKVGEIDIIMTNNDILIFIEVKYRKDSDWVSAVESVTRSKQRKIIKAAQLYLLKNKKYQDWNCRFDVVSIQGDKTNPQINWIKHAFY
ncbi:MAG: YraN family protein [Proteobacteria bacterium]|nr:YraN family protein [Pseudomonadota bacterium]